MCRTTFILLEPNRGRFVHREGKAERFAHEEGKAGRFTYSERQPFGRCCLDHPSLLLPRLMGAATAEVAAVAMVAAAMAQAATAQAATELVIALMAEMRPRLLPLPPGVWPFLGRRP